jgi:hypothetical protein
MGRTLAIRWQEIVGLVHKPTESEIVTIFFGTRQGSLIDLVYTFAED